MKLDESLLLSSYEMAFGVEATTNAGIITFLKNRAFSSVHLNLLKSPVYNLGLLHAMKRVKLELEPSSRD